MPVQPTDEILKDEVDADGDLTPKALAARKRLANDLKEGTKKKGNATRTDRRKAQKEREEKKKPKKQKITNENAVEKMEVLKEVKKIADNKRNIIESAEVHQELEDYYPEILENKEIGWKPFEGPQTDFLEADEFEVLFSVGS